MIETVNVGFGNYDMDDASRALYEFIWSEYCDWYVELAKPRLRGDAGERAQVQAILYYVLETTLRLLHPIMPFITEEIWQALPHEGDSIMMAKFPESDTTLIDEQAEERMKLLIEGARVQRELKASAQIALRENVEAGFVSGAPKALSREEMAFLEQTAGTSMQTWESAPENPERYLVGTVVGLGTLYLRAPEVDLEKEFARIHSELAAIEKDLSRSQCKLSSEQFTSKAPAEIVDKERRIVAELSEKKQKLLERKAALSK